MFITVCHCNQVTQGDTHVVSISVTLSFFILKWIFGHMVFHCENFSKFHIIAWLANEYISTEGKKWALCAFLIWMKGNTRATHFWKEDYNFSLNFHFNSEKYTLILCHRWDQTFCFYSQYLLENSSSYQRKMWKFNKEDIFHFV